MKRFSPSEPVSKTPFVALGKFLKECEWLITLGVRPLISSYTRYEQELIKKSPIIFFPTTRYVALFQAIGKPTFPSPYSYYFKKRRLLQWTLASYLNLPRLKTRCYKKGSSIETVLENFSLPVRILNLNNNSSTGTVIETREKLGEIFQSTPRMIIVQEIPTDVMAEVMLVFSFYELVGLRWTEGDAKLPPFITELTSNTVKTAHLDDIAVRWILTERGWLFAGMELPPGVFYTYDNKPVDRKIFLCERIKEIATEPG